jgi:hypothetical protein
VVITSIYCSREDIVSLLFLIGKVLAELDLVVFPFTLESFSRTNFGVLLVVVVEFIFLHCSWVS